MSYPRDPADAKPAALKVSDETIDRTLQNFRDRIAELTAQNSRLRFTLESIKASAQRELRRKPIE